MAGAGERIVAIRAGVLLLLFVVSVLVYLPQNGFAILGQTAGLGTQACEEGHLCVYYFDVGQGDATFIESPTGTQVLIDGGPDGSVLRELGTVMGYLDKSIDVMIATHPDKDHIGGLIDVLERYEVLAIVRTENESDTSAWKQLERLAVEEGADIVYARRGQVYDIGGGVELEVLFPDRDPSGMESNASSIVMRLTFGGTSFLFTGDSPKSIEEYLVLVEGERLMSDVLKVGHHGSRTSTSELFLAEVDPRYAVMSFGEGNTYGHPHVEVTDALFNYDVETHTTAKEGTIEIRSNGTEITF